MCALHGLQANTCKALSRLAAQLRFEGTEARRAIKSHPQFARLAQLAAQHCKPGGFNARQVATVATCYAWLQHAPGERLLERLAQRMQALLQGEATAADDVCHTLWALAKLGHPAPVLLEASAAHSVSAGWVNQLPGKQLASMLWAHARLLAHDSSSNDGSSSVAEHEVVSLAAVPPSLPALVDAAAANMAAPGFLETFTPHELAQLLWSLAKLRHVRRVPEALLARVCDVAEPLVVRFNPQGIANSCWALARLAEAQGTPDSSTSSTSSKGGILSGCGRSTSAKTASGASMASSPSTALAASTQRLFATFGDAAAARLDYYKPQEVANLMGACARMATCHRPLLAATSRYVRLRSHLLGEQDVCELLAALAALRKLHTAEPMVLQRLEHRAVHFARAGRLPPYQAATAAWALARLGYAPAGLVTELWAHLAAGHGSDVDAAGGRCSEVLGAFEPRALAQLLWASSCCGVGARVPLVAAQAALLRVLPSCDGRALAMSLVALARMVSSQCDAALLKASAARLVELLPSMEPQGVVQAMWALAKLAPTGASSTAQPETCEEDSSSGSSSSSSGDQVYGQNSLQVAIHASAEQLLLQPGCSRHLSAQAVAMCMWGLAASGTTPSSAVMSACCAAASDRMLQLTPQGLAMVCWSCAVYSRHRAGQQQQQQLAELQVRLGERMQDFIDQLLRSTSSRPAGSPSPGTALTPVELASFSVAAAQLHLSSPELLEGLAAAGELLMERGQCGAGEAAQLVWALGRLGYDGPQEQLLEGLCELLSEHLGCGNLQGTNSSSSSSSSSGWGAVNGDGSNDGRHRGSVKAARMTVRTLHKRRRSTRNDAGGDAPPMLASSSSSSSSSTTTTTARSTGSISGSGSSCNSTALPLSQLLMALSAFGAVGQRPPPHLCDSMCAALAARVPQLSTPALCTAMEALAQLAGPSKMLLQALLQQLSIRLLGAAFPTNPSLTTTLGPAASQVLARPDVSGAGSALAQGEEQRAGLSGRHAVRMLWALCALQAYDHRRLCQVVASAAFNIQPALLQQEPRLLLQLLEAQMLLRAERRQALWRPLAPKWRRLRARGAPKQLLPEQLAEAGGVGPAHRRAVGVAKAGVDGVMWHVRLPGLRVRWVVLPSGDVACLVSWRLDGARTQLGPGAAGGGDAAAAHVAMATDNAAAPAASASAPAARAHAAGVQHRCTVALCLESSGAGGRRLVGRVIRRRLLRAWGCPVLSTPLEAWQGSGSNAQQQAALEQRAGQLRQRLVAAAALAG